MKTYSKIIFWHLGTTAFFAFVAALWFYLSSREWGFYYILVFGPLAAGLLQLLVSRLWMLRAGKWIIGALSGALVGFLSMPVCLYFVLIWLHAIGAKDWTGGPMANPFSWTTIEGLFLMSVFGWIITFPYAFPLSLLGGLILIAINRRYQS